MVLRTIVYKPLIRVIWEVSVVNMIFFKKANNCLTTDGFTQPRVKEKFLCYDPYSLKNCPKKNPIANSAQPVHVPMFTWENFFWVLPLQLLFPS